MNIKFCIYVILIFFSFAGAEDYRLFNNLEVSDNTQDTLVIFAPLIEFAKDEVLNTATDGKFILKNDLNLEPAPHDKNYFSKQLEFIKNYFYKVSNGKLVIKYYLFPSLENSYNLAKPIYYYSPENIDAKDDSLMAFVRDAISLISKDISFTQQWNIEKQKENDHYRVGLVIFRAGITALTDGLLTGIRNNPWDISDAFIRPIDFEKYSNIVQGKEKILDIDRLAIIPEQATQDSLEFKQAGIPFVELSIHSIMIYQFYKLLGVPDLAKVTDNLAEPFVGIFSPLDPISYLNIKSAGIFSPTPSAFEKYFLGWYKVKDVRINEPFIIKNEEVYKLKIDSSLQFFIEYKGKNKQTINLTIENNGQLTSYELKESDIFNQNSTNIQNIPKGIIVDVDDYNFILPKKGILLWRVNFDIINKYLKDDKINNGNTQEYGVDLLEKSLEEKVGYSYFRDFSGNRIYEEGDSSCVFYENDSTLLLTFNNVFTHYKLKVLKNFEDSALVKVYSNEIFYKPAFDSSKVKEITLTNSPEIIINDSIFITFEKNVIYKNKEQLVILNEEVQKIVPFRFVYTKEISLFVLDKKGNLSLISLDNGANLPFSRKVNVKDIFLLSKDDNNKILIIYKNNEIEVLNPDFKTEVGYFVYHGGKIRFALFPWKLVGDPLYIDKYGLYAKEDKGYLYYKLINYGDSLVGISSNKYYFDSFDNDEFNYHFYFYPNPVRKSQTKNIYVRFYTNKKVEHFNIKILSLDAQIKKEVTFNSEVGWNKIKVSIDNFKSDVYIVLCTFRVDKKEYQVKKRLVIIK